MKPIAISRISSWYRCVFLSERIVFRRKVTQKKWNTQVFAIFRYEIYAFSRLSTKKTREHIYITKINRIYRASKCEVRRLN